MLPIFIIFQVLLFLNRPNHSTPLHPSKTPPPPNRIFNKRLTWTPPPNPTEQNSIQHRGTRYSDLHQKVRRPPKHRYKDRWSVETKSLNHLMVGRCFISFFNMVPFQVTCSFSGVYSGWCSTPYLLATLCSSFSRNKKWSVAHFFITKHSPALTHTMLHVGTGFFGWLVDFPFHHRFVVNV